MARGQQAQFDFRGADADADVSFRYQMAIVRDALSAIAATGVGLSDRMFSQVKELIMATRAYELAGRQPAIEDLLKTSGLSARQWKAARQQALGLGLIRVVRVYRGQRRLPDQLAVAVEVILARSKTRLQPVCSPSATRPQPVPSSTVNPRARAGAALELPKPSTSTTTGLPRVGSDAYRFGGSAAIVRGTGRPVVEEVILEEGIQNLAARCRAKFKGHCPTRIETAIRQATINGATIGQLVERCSWFFRTGFHVYKSDHVAGALFEGLINARSGMAVDEGWPYR